MSLLAVQQPAVQPVKVEDYLYLAEIVARNYYRGKEDIKDTELYSLCCEELVRCAAGYTPSMGKFDSYAWKSLHNGVIDHIRAKKAKKRTAVFERLTDQGWDRIEGRDDNTPLPLHILSILMDGSGDTAQDAEDRELLRAVHLKGRNVKDLAEELGVSRVTVYNRLKRILGRIRDRHGALIERYGDDEQG
jgi:RNA polymerase sigma factor (sigma-70 family)